MKKAIANNNKIEMVVNERVTVQQSFKRIDERIANILTESGGDSYVNLLTSLTDIFEEANELTEEYLQKANVAEQQRRFSSFLMDIKLLETKFNSNCVILETSIKHEL